eukprot:TRINITY_DN276_c0_g1_i1.p1 TRINITY_DN276_c0_g1~~TRINITY_DN276_c0_g1_i1.p1  ORF type:complete len:902 (+),score=214.75 TRINITY_DN276_c0_g1_i1:35-2740(+)
MLRAKAVLSQSRKFAALSQSVNFGGSNCTYFDLTKLRDPRYNSLPFSIRVLLESAVRNCDGLRVHEADVEKILDWKQNAQKDVEIPFIPARVILQDFTGVPAVVDLAAMREAFQKLGGDPAKITPLVPVDLVIDHSVQVDAFGTSQALETNEALEFQRNKERFQFLKWGSRAFDGLTIVPPGNGIVHQVNLEHLARVVFNQNGVLYPDSTVGTDSHTTMINGLGVVGWGVGGIEAEAAMLGQPLSMVLPKVVGYKLTGKPSEGVTATDIVLTITQALRKHGVVGKFVEFYGPGIAQLSLADRATLSNMAPEYGATIGFFPVDDVTCQYLRQSGRPESRIEQIQGYLKAVSMYSSEKLSEAIEFTEHLVLDLSTVEPSLAGPKRPQDRVPLKDMKRDFSVCLGAKHGHKGFGVPAADHGKSAPFTYKDTAYTLSHGSVVIAAITSCTNTSNPGVMLAAGLLAEKAVKLGLKVKPYVKTSLSPGSGVVREYLRLSGLQEPLDKLGFALAGFGCMTCIGNSGDLPEPVSQAISQNNLTTAAVLSGNRNFEARIHPLVQAAYLASPPLVVAYALAGSVNIDFATEPIGTSSSGQPVFLRDVWPTNQEVKAAVEKFVQPELFKQVYSGVEKANKRWNELAVPAGSQYQWDDANTYIHNPPFFKGLSATPRPTDSIQDAYCLLYLGDSVTTDHISPAGNIAATSPAAKWLLSRGVQKADFNTYGSRRGNDLVMTRGTFANVSLGNRLIGEGKTGPKTIHFPSNQQLPVFDAAVEYQNANAPLIILAGKEYGSGSSRDWAAKGTYLLGVKAVIAESFERIHRSNLAGMGVVPLQFRAGESAASLGLTGKERFSITLGDLNKLQPFQEIDVKADGKTFKAILRFDTPIEIKYYEHGGILPYVLRQKLKA